MNEPTKTQPAGTRRDFRVAQIGNGATAHYVDDYRYQPGRTICGRWLAESDEVRAELDLPLCGVCCRRDGYPTEAEFREYHVCTDCGVDTSQLGESCYTVRHKLWNIAYPLYRTGVGVGSSRPCIGCLEKRLGRALTVDDFILLPDRYWVAGTLEKPTVAVVKVNIGAKIWRYIFRGRSSIKPPATSWKKPKRQTSTGAPDTTTTHVGMSTPPPRQPTHCSTTWPRPDPPSANCKTSR